MSREESQLRTNINRALIEAGLAPASIPDPAVPLRKLELMGDRRAAEILRDMRRLGWA